MTRVVSNKLRESANGRDCTLRLDGCLHNYGVVLAHLPTTYNGMGMKSPDNMAVFGCSHCHRVLDGPDRYGIPMRDIVRALGETQMYWIGSGLMSIVDVKI